MVTRSVTRSVTQPVAIPFALAGRSMLRLPYRGASLSLAFDSQQYAMGAIGKRPAAFAFSDLITFTRASGGGRFNASGQYEWLPANQPRFDYDPVTGEAKGLLIEEQRTNLLKSSNAFLPAYWTYSSATLAANSAMAPDATLTAGKLKEIATATGVTHGVSTSSTITSGVQYTASVYVKSAGDSRRLEFRSYNGLNADTTTVVNVETGTVI